MSERCPWYVKIGKSIPKNPGIKRKTPSGQFEFEGWSLKTQPDAEYTK